MFKAEEYGEGGTVRLSVNDTRLSQGNDGDGAYDDHDNEGNVENNIK